MDKKTVIITIGAVLLLALIIGGYVYWSNLKESGEKSALEDNGKTAGEITETESAVKGILPSLETNPLEDKPNVNPADAANPIKNIKTNPFK